MPLAKPTGSICNDGVGGLFKSIRWMSASLFFTALIVLSPVADNAFDGFLVPALGLTALALFGLPHGGADAWVMWIIARRSPTRFLAWIGIYIGITSIAALLFFLIPAVAWSLFLAVSVFHFGWEGSNQRESRLLDFERTAFNFTRGLTVVFAGSFSQPEFAQTILELSSSSHFASWFVAAAELFSTRIIFPVSVFLVVFACTRPSWARLTAITDLALLLLAFLSLPPFAAFVWYFCCVHSVYHWRELFVFVPVAAAGSWGNISRFATGLLFALPPISGWYWLGSENSMGAIFFSYEGVATALVGLGILTFPHMLLIHNLSRREVRGPYTASEGASLRL